jgi:hypothetical protein
MVQESCCDTILIINNIVRLHTTENCTNFAILNAVFILQYGPTCFELFVHYLAPDLLHKLQCINL